LNHIPNLQYSPVSQIRLHFYYSESYLLRLFDAQVSNTIKQL